MARHSKRWDFLKAGDELLIKCPFLDPEHRRKWIHHDIRSRYGAQALVESTKSKHRHWVHLDDYTEVRYSENIWYSSQGFVQQLKKN